jgi:NAD(P)H-dependent FMN reductase
MEKKLSNAGLQTTSINLGDYPLALFNADIEKANGEPENAITLAELFSKADVIFIASPEYNGSVSALLKNTLDWISRQENAPYKRAVFGIGAASPGKMGGVKGLGHLRDILNNMGALVAPSTLGVGNGKDAFDEGGVFKDEDINKRAENLINQLTRISRDT